jgi:hypothetical protein
MRRGFMGCGMLWMRSAPKMQIGRFIFLIPFFLLHPSCVILAQNISGIINTYQRVVAIDTCFNAATVVSEQGFAIGDRVLILQMKGATIDTSNSPNYGAIQSLNGAGQFEIATIFSMPNLTTIRFRDKLLNNYDAGNGDVQLVRIPQYTDVTVVDTLRPKPWDPNTGTGGVLILEASGTLTLRAQVDASYCGFWGGGAANSRIGDSVIDYLFDGMWGEGGYKGEGIASKIGLYYDPFIAAGRGAPANGGGGGNAENSGGGGGANVGNGGRGGDQTNAPEYGRFANGGEPGSSLPYTSLPRIFMGGGGGGGHQNDHYGSDGGYGGGIVILRAPTIISAFDTIQANGGSPGANFGLAPWLSRSDGAGGGGAGGSIIIITDSIFLPNHTEGAIWLQLIGGDGGSVDADNSPYGFGPGGGGGAGMYARIGNGWGVWWTETYGGKAGQLTNCTDPTISNTSYGASNGTTAGESPNRELPESTIPYIYPAALSHSFTICSDDTSALSASGGDSYLWSPSVGLNNPTIANPRASPSTTTVYTVAITKGNCNFADTVHVEVLPQPLATFDGPTNVCSGSTHIYSISQQTNTTYIWTITGGTPTSGTGDSIQVIWNTSGMQTISLQASNGLCSATSSQQISVAAPIVPVITATSIVIANPGDQSTLSVTGNYAGYLWSTGETAPSITVTVPGVFSVTVTDANGCTGADSIEIESPAGLPSIELALGTIQGRPGDHVMLPVTIIRSQNILGAVITDFSYTIHFNKSLLAPLDPNVTSVFTGNERSVTKHGTISNQLSTNTLDNIEFIAALGDATATDISFDTVIWSSGKQIETTLDNGHFTLLGVCPAGGNRLFTDSTQISLNVPRPNPVHDLAAIDYSLVEPGETNFTVVDLLGRTMMTLASGAASAGNYHATLDASKLPNGVYTLVLRTPSQIFTAQMEVYH